MMTFERTLAELHRELDEDRNRDEEFEQALLDRVHDGQITMEEAMQHLWGHLVNDDVDDTSRVWIVREEDI
jgi:hypothetical protein